MSGGQQAASCKPQAPEAEDDEWCTMHFRRRPHCPCGARWDSESQKRELARLNRLTLSELRALSDRELRAVPNPEQLAAALRKLRGES